MASDQISVSAHPPTPAAEVDGGTAGAAGLSRRALLLAGMALVAAGCGRTTQDRMAGVPMRPANNNNNGPDKSPAAPTKEPVPPPSLPPKPVAGRGYVMVPRAAWTSAPVKGNNNLMGAVTRLTVHHTGEHGNWADLPDIEIIQRIESYHRNEKNWAAIGYHYLVGKDGRIYEGRPVMYQGAHVSTQNENNLGVSVIGDFMNRLPSERQLASLSAFLDDQRKKYGVGRARVYGHRDLHASLCPGNALYQWVCSYKVTA